MLILKFPIHAPIAEENIPQGTSGERNDEF